MNGGALWRVYFEMRGNPPSIVGKRLYGIPFFQSRGSNGGKIITCHGPNGIYEELVDKALERWPNEQG